MAMTDGAREWMTVAQAAEYCGVHVDTIRMWFDQKKLNGWQTPGGARRIWKDAAARKARDEHAQKRRETS